MLYKGRDSQKEKIAVQTKYYTAFRVPDKRRKLLYHYAGIETIWKILESDSFLARNIRFSNDSKEYKLGEKVIRRYAKRIFPQNQQEKFNVRIQQGIQMFYMICFCREGDLLSQWRGYAKNGVSLGMDFSEESKESQKHTEMFTILNNQYNRENGEKYKLNKKYVRFIEMPYQVFYIDNDMDVGIDNKKKGKMNDEAILGDALESFDDDDMRANMLLNLIPFIKDRGFKEEAEYRILFDIGDLGETEAQNRKIRSRKIEYTIRDNQKLPNIIVEVGDGEKKCSPVKQVVLGKGIEDRAKKQGMQKKLREEVYDTIATELMNYSVSCERSNEKQDIYIGEGNNQEDIMSKIEDILQEKGLPIDCEGEIKIWCRGHLPIREVIIAPGEMKEKIRESLKHYMQNTYWLRYVDVKDSQIPLQS